MMAEETPICNFGWTAEDFNLKGTDEQYHTLESIKGSKATLVMFICNHCPYVQAVIERLNSTVLDLKKYDVGAVGIMSNDTNNYPEDSFENMKLFSKKHNFCFPYVIDENQEIAKKYSAVCTPDFFGFDSNLGLQYRGRLDESKTNLVPNAKRELFEAMSVVSKTGKGPQKQFPSMGCSIKWR